MLSVSFIPLLITNFCIYYFIWLFKMRDVRGDNPNSFIDQVWAWSFAAGNFFTTEPILPHFDRWLRPRYSRLVQIRAKTNVSRRLRKYFNWYLFTILPLIKAVLLLRPRSQNLTKISIWPFHAAMLSRSQCGIKESCTKLIR